MVSTGKQNFIEIFYSTSIDVLIGLTLLLLLRYIFLHKPMSKVVNGILAFVGCVLFCMIEMWVCNILALRPHYIVVLIFGVVAYISFAPWQEKSADHRDPEE